MRCSDRAKQDSRSVVAASSSLLVTWPTQKEAPDKSLLKNSATFDMQSRVVKKGNVYENTE